MRLVHTPSHQEALAAQPGHPWLVNDLANALWLDDALPQALSWARWATRPQAKPVHPLAWRTLGNVLLELGRFAEADAAYQRADPQGLDPATQFNRSKAQLGLGNWAMAWRLAEQRLALDPPPGRLEPGPWWQGWPDAARVSVWSEQGLGDALQFLRWLPALLAMGKRVQVLVPSPLVTVLQQGLAWMGPELDVAPLEASGHPLECHGSLLSLPWQLRQPEPPSGLPKSAIGSSLVQSPHHPAPASP